MIRLKHLGKRLFSNMALKFVALTSAISIWAWVQSETIVEENLRIRVRYMWPTDLERVNEPRSTVNITLKGPQGRLKGIEESDIEALIDLSEMKIGRNGVDLTESDLLNVPTGVSIQRISPPTVEIELDLPMEKTVTIKPNIVGSVPDGWKIKKATVSPETIVLKGARSLLVGLSEISSDAIDVSGLKSDKTFKGLLSLPNANLRSDPKPIDIRVEIGTLFEKKSYANIPVVVRANESWETKPKQVLLEMEGPLSELESLQEREMTVLVHLPNTDQDQFNLDYKLNAKGNPFVIVHNGSPSIKTLTMNPKSLQISKVKTNEKTFEPTQMEVRNENSKQPGGETTEPLINEDSVQ